MERKRSASSSSLSHKMAPKEIKVEHTDLFMNKAGHNLLTSIKTQTVLMPK
jgi:hypothetical protein